MNTISTINVPFHGNNLYVVNYNGQPYVPMRPIVEGMGMDWTGQLNKLKQKFKSTVEEISIVAADGKERNMICLALRKLAGWLHTISPNKVKPEIRDKVIQYQEECDDVLYEYWTTGEVKAKHKSTVQERNPLKNAVNLLVSKKGIMYPEAYSLVHQQFNVSGIDELTADQIPMAVEYVHKLVMEGEYIPKQQLPQVGLESLAMPMSFFDEYDWLFDLEGVDKAESLSEFYRYPQKMLKNMAEYPNPLIEILTKLRGMGVNIDAAYFWLKALQHRYEVNTSSLNRKEKLLSDVLLSNTSVAHNIIKSIIDEWRNILAPAIKKLNPALESEVTKQLSELNGVIYCNLLSLKEKPETKLLA
ncbi:phage antirepressor N-terminal domain-containing protein [Providencia rettgeri]|uniref:phage antirepressor N-terminal domain-containing protein n=1 Tax=Providencia rettgeri TaxID=587 RepID=UPI00206FB77D|nr:phage antirepressor N-terminal domain-containing protein [Providencia rettgeri]UPS64237.1 phage antirepressor N-terminal domain-containing protein [Providencia rettgeri]